MEPPLWFRASVPGLHPFKLFHSTCLVPTHWGAPFGTGLVYELLALAMGSLLCVGCGAGSWWDGDGGHGRCSH